MTETNLCSLPNELLRDMAEWLWDEADLNAFARVNRRMHSLLNDYLYSHNVDRYELGEIRESRVALIYARDHDVPEATYRRSLKAISARDTTKCSDVARSALYIAINRGCTDVARMHLELDPALQPDENGQVDRSCVVLSCSLPNPVVFWVLATSHLFDANARDTRGKTPLMGACNYGLVDVARFLVDKGADVNARDDDGYSPVYNAGEHGKVEMLELLAAAGTRLDVNPKTKGGATPLWRAMYLSRREASLFLARQPGVDCYGGDTFGYGPIQLAVLDDDIEMLRAMVDEGGADVNYDPHACGNTLVAFAAARGRVKALEFLLGVEGAQVNPKPGVSCWPLMAAAQHGQARAIEVLLAHPATDAGATDENGNTALLVAVYHGHAEVVEAFLAAGRPDPNRRCSRGYTVVGTAVEKQDAPMLRRLLSVPGIDAEVVDDFGQTPLDAAVRKGDVECARVLLECEQVAKGSAVRVDKNPYEAAREKGDRKMEMLLLPYYEKSRPAGSDTVTEEVKVEVAKDE